MLLEKFSSIVSKLIFFFGIDVQDILVVFPCSSLAGFEEDQEIPGLGDFWLPWTELGEGKQSAVKNQGIMEWFGEEGS